VNGAADLQLRLAYLDLGPADLELLRELRPLLEQHADALVAAFYRHLLSFEATRRLLREPEVRDRLVGLQRAYLLSLAGPRLDEDYLADRRRIGRAHERVGLEPRWYLGAYALYFSLLAPLVGSARADDPALASRTLVALQRLLSLDASLAMESYLERHERALADLTRELAREGRQLERELEDRSAELSRTRARARAAEEVAAIAALVAGLAHEIGTPLGVIQGHARRLEAGADGDDELWRLRTIQEQIARISRIIQTLLALARPRPTRRAPVALEPVIATSLSFVREQLAERGIEARVCCDRVPLILGDAERLQQLFLNLFLNALEAMPGGGELRVSLAETPEGEVEARVGDTGVGISAGDLARIFEPFFTSKPAGEGYGLGLVAARGIAGDHGGAIEVESRVGEGSEFRIRFPAAPAEASGPGPAPVQQ
jgi:signal transduction histidine kinase